MTRAWWLMPIRMAYALSNYRRNVSNFGQSTGEGHREVKSPSGLENLGFLRGEWLRGFHGGLSRISLTVVQPMGVAAAT